MSAVDDLDPRPLNLFGLDPVACVACDRKEANRLLVRWDHGLGPCDRPFGQDHWLLVVRGEPVSLAVTASTVSSTVKDETERPWARMQMAELARLCSAPGANWATRVTLRLWREVLVREWRHWTPELLVSYAMPGKAGNIYRADGWTRVRETKPSSGGGTWSKAPAVNALDGNKTLWVFHLDAP